METNEPASVDLEATFGKLLIDRGIEAQKMLMKNEGKLKPEEMKLLETGLALELGKAVFEYTKGIR